MATVSVRERERAEPESTRRGDLARRARRALDRALLLGAGATALILAGGLVWSLVSVFTVRHPNLGWSDNVVAEAKAVATGHLQYGNPATQPLGPYTPLFTWLFAGLLRLYWWEGWGAVVSMLAAAAAIVALIRMIWAATSGWEVRVAGASFVVVLALGSLSAYQPNGVYEARPDQLAWSLLVIAGAMTFGSLLTGEPRSARHKASIGLLLTASVFTKQPTLVPAVLVAGFTLAIPRADAAVSEAKWRAALRSATTPIVFVATSVVFGAALQVASHGYAFNHLVRDTFGYPRYVTLRQELHWGLQRTSVPLIAFVLLVAAAAWSLWASRREEPRRHVFVAAAAVAVALSPIPTAIAAAMKLGGNFNQYSGPVWTVTLGGSVLLVLLRPSLRQLTATALACGVLLAGSGVLPHSWMSDTIGKPQLDQRVKWVGMDPFLSAAVARGEAVYDWEVPSLSVSRRAPDHPAGDWVDRFNAGYTPRYFIRDLLDGSYALVRPMPVDTVSTAYWSSLGRYDASIAWKINDLLALGYAPVQNPDSGIYYYEPTPKLARLGWFAQCFGPYRAQAAGVDARVHGSGGLVCVEDGRLHLRDAPGPATTLVVHLRPGAGSVTIELGHVPSVLALSRLHGQDRPLRGADGAAPVSLLEECLASHGNAYQLTVVAARAGGSWTCRTGRGRPVLEAPVESGAARLAIDVAATDSPTIAASTAAGSPTQFAIWDPPAR